MLPGHDHGFDKSIFWYCRKRPNMVRLQGSMQGCDSSVGSCSLGGRMRWRRWAVDDGLMEPLLPCTGECGAAYRDGVSLTSTIPSPEDSCETLPSCARRCTAMCELMVVVKEYMQLLLTI